MDKDESLVRAKVMLIVEEANAIFSSDISVTTGTGKHEPVRLHLKMLIVADDEKCQNFGPGSVYCRPKSFVGDADGFLRSHASLDFSRYCLAYLFTSHEIAGDTLGVAYVNGTCEKYQRVKDLKTGRSMKISMNSGFITIEDPTNPAAIKDAQHTLAHEIGHNFGASHDTPKSCGGYTYLGYLMSPVSPIASLATRKSRQFSPCSLEAIGEVLSEISSGRKRWCFRGSGGDDDDDDELPPPHENVPADAAAGGGRVPELPSIYDVGIIEDMVPKEDGGGPQLTGATIALAVVLLLVLVATGAFLVWTFVEQKFCFGRGNAHDYSAIRGVQSREMDLKMSRTKSRPSVPVFPTSSSRHALQSGQAEHKAQKEHAR